MLKMLQELVVYQWDGTLVGFLMQVAIMSSVLIAILGLHAAVM